MSKWLVVMMAAGALLLAACSGGASADDSVEGESEAASSTSSAAEPTTTDDVETPVIGVLATGPSALDTMVADEFPDPLIDPGEVISGGRLRDEHPSRVH